MCLRLFHCFDSGKQRKGPTMNTLKILHSAAKIIPTRDLADIVIQLQVDEIWTPVLNILDLKSG